MYEENLPEHPIPEPTQTSSVATSSQAKPIVQKIVAESNESNSPNAIASTPEPVSVPVIKSVPVPEDETMPVVENNGEVEEAEDDERPLIRRRRRRSSAKES